MPSIRKAGLLLRIVFLLCPLLVGGQNIELIENIRNELKTANDVQRLELFNQLSWEYRSAFPDSTVKYGEQALALARQLSIATGKPRTLNYIGLGHYYKGNLLIAHEFFERALTEATVLKDTAQLGFANNNIGRLFSEQGMLTQSFPYFVHAEACFKSIDDQSGLAYVYQSFAGLYKTQKNFVTAEENYQRALSIRKELGNTRDVMSAMVLIGKLYLEVQQFEDALLYFHKADSASKVIDDALARAETKVLIAEYYLGKKDLDKAETLTKEGLSYILNFNNVKLLPRAYLVLGEVYFTRGSYPVAQKFLTIALAIATRMRYVDMKMQAHYLLWRVSDEAGGREAALFHSNQYLVLKDSLQDIDISGRVAKYQFQLEIQRKQQENELLRNQEQKNALIIEQDNQQRLGLIVLVIFISVLFYLQWRHARKRRIVNIELTARKEQIELQAGEIRKQLEEIERINGTLSEKVDEISNRNDALESHLLTLVGFSKNKSINFGSLNEAARDIARLTAQALAVSRVSIWHFSENGSVLESVAIYDLKKDTLLDNTTITLSEYPKYSEALRVKRVINAVDARTHEDTSEFAERYLAPNDIYSMLDVVYSMDGRLGGLLCLEHQGMTRTWKPEDLIFTNSVSDVISLTYRNVQRREYEQRLRQQSKEITRMNEVLEQRVRDRTMELENQNKQLTEYAFINSHLLRSPVSKILGLLQLMELGNEDETQIMTYLKTACEEMDAVVKRITIALENGDHFDRSTITKL